MITLMQKRDKTEFLSSHIQNMHFLKPVNKQRNQSKKKKKSQTDFLKPLFGQQQFLYEGNPELTETK